jgi:conjugal transfer pilus assembly protein TraB
MENKEVNKPKNIFKDMDETKKKRVIAIGLGALVFLFGLAVYFNSRTNQVKQQVQTEKPPVNVQERDVVKENWQVQESKKVAELEERLKKMEEEKKKLEEEQKNNSNSLPSLPSVVGNNPQNQQVILPPPPPSPPTSMPSVNQQVPSPAPLDLPPPPPPKGGDHDKGKVEEKVEKPKPTYQVLGDLIEYKGFSENTEEGKKGNSSSFSPMKSNSSSSEGDASGSVANVPPSVNDVSYTGSNKTVHKKTVDTYIPPGTFAKVVLLSGVNAPSGGNASGNPVPILLKMQSLSILPNKFKSDFRECFIVGSAIGDLKSERAYVRAETLSCVKKDGTVLERPVTGYVAGEDGKAGLLGRVVTKSGQMIARSILAGFVEGVSRAFSMQSMSVSVSPLGQTSTVNPDQALKYGFAQGLSSGAMKLVDFYLNLANALVPVIEVNAGREVDFVFLKGVDLTEDTRR